MKSRASFAFVGALLGMVAVSCWIGGVIGWQQSGQWPAWLAVPLGVGMGPIYLLIDLADLIGGKPEGMIVLPQALIGGLVGALIGWVIAHIRSRMLAWTEVKKG
jgi:prepilin signal peptidase PulO-like enzyme (type II secretory pathway)